MANDYKLVITSNGLTKLANANINGERLRLTQYSVGDGVLTPSANTVALVSEKYRANLNAVEIDNGVATIDCVLPTEVGGWYIRECGLWDNDGELFASTVLPTTYKVSPSEGAAKTIQIRARIAINNAESIGFETDETVIYATQDWTLDRLALKAQKATTITVGAGLSGGGDLSADRTLSLGTPSTITISTTNAATSETHTHALNTSGLVLTSGDQTIEGVKTFSVAPVVPDNSFATTMIADEAVTTAKIADAAVTTAKIADGAIPFGKFASVSVAATLITSSQTYTVPATGLYKISAVGGGGGGGAGGNASNSNRRGAGGGGGGGAMVVRIESLVKGQQIAVAIGAGGAQSGGGGNVGGSGGNGGWTQFDAYFGAPAGYGGLGGGDGTILAPGAGGSGGTFGVGFTGSYGRNGNAGNGENGGAGAQGYSLGGVVRGSGGGGGCGDYSSGGAGGSGASNGQGGAGWGYGGAGGAGGVYIECIRAW
jgi:hypothetical protein